MKAEPLNIATNPREENSNDMNQFIAINGFDNFNDSAQKRMKDESKVDQGDGGQQSSASGTATEDSVLSICPQCDFCTVSIQQLDEHMDKQHGQDTAGGVPGSLEVSSDEPSSKLDLNPGFFISSVSSELQARLEPLRPLKSSLSMGASTPGGSGSVSDSRRRYRCNICPVTFPWHGDLAAHLSEAHGFQKASRDGSKSKAGSYKCSYCMYVAKYQSELKRHRRLHMGVKPFGCVFCKYRSAWKGDLKRHIESHHRGNFASEEELAAIMAQYKNNAGTDIKESQESNDYDGCTNDSFSDHVKTASPSVVSEHMGHNHACTSCGFEATTSQTLQQHIAEEHLQADAVKPIVKSETKEPGSGGRKKLSKPHKNNNNNSDSMEAILNLSTNNRSTAISSISMSSTNSILNSITSVINNSINNNNSRNVKPIDTSFLNHNTKILPTEALNLSKRSTNSYKTSDVQNTTVNLPSPANDFSKLSGILPLSLKPELLPPHLLSSGGLNFTDLMRGMLGQLMQSSQSMPPSLQPPQLLHPHAPHLHTSGFPPLPEPLFLPFPQHLDPQHLIPPPPLASLESGYHASTPQQKEVTSASSTPTNLSISATTAAQQEHWKRFKCSACGHRSNWKWDINKHIKVAHPERDGITTMELSYEEAKSTLQNYLNSTKANKSRCHNSFESEEGYYRPYKCSACGHRSNWKWDVNKHIKQVHQRQAEVITLSMEEAKRTICQYKRRRRVNNGSTNLGGGGGGQDSIAGIGEPGEVTVSGIASGANPVPDVDSNGSNMTASLDYDMNHNHQEMEEEEDIEEEDDSEELDMEDVPAPVTPSMTSSSANPRIDRLRLKRLKCAACGYRSNYRSDISRHIRRKHDSAASIVFLSEISNDCCQETPQLGCNSQQQHRPIWQCKLCIFSHRDKAEVSQHIGTVHQPRRPFSCRLCEYGSDYRNSLLRHLRAKHKVSSGGDDNDISSVMEQNMCKTRLAITSPLSGAATTTTPSSDCGTAAATAASGGDTKLCCSRCQAAFDSYQHMFQHIALTHAASDEEMYLIFKPPQLTQQQQQQAPADSEASEMAEFRCDRCPYRSCLADSARIHQFQHSELCRYFFQCSQCGYRASHSKFLSHHEQQHHEQELNKQQHHKQQHHHQEQEQTKRHARGRTDIKRCRRCQFRCGKAAHLRVHYQTRHNTLYRPPPPVAAIAELSAPAPRQVNAESVNFYRGLTSACWLWCDECGYVASGQASGLNEEADLERHLRQHLQYWPQTQERLYCHLCSFSCESTSQMADHEVCHVLDESSGLMDRAATVAVTATPLSCTECDYVTDCAAKMQLHRHFHQTHTAQHAVNFSCFLCSFRHPRLYGLVRHLKYHHNSSSSIQPISTATHYQPLSHSS